MQYIFKNLYINLFGSQIVLDNRLIFQKHINYKCFILFRKISFDSINYKKKKTYFCSWING